jgi:predicted nucleic acid-binding protein
MRFVTYDSSVFIAYKPDFPTSGFYLSAVVLQELVVGAPDKSGRKVLEVAYGVYKKKKLLLVPDDEDWWEAGKILNRILMNKREHGERPRLPPNKKQEIIRDILIARTAHKVKALVVTDNVNDFELIARYCQVKWESGAEYFKRS